MTAPRGAVVFNQSTGSDSAASGLGPATAVSGAAAAHTGGSATTTITFTNSPDLSGVVAGDMLWLDTSSGRQYSVIVSVDNGAKTAVVDDSFNIASGSPVNYGIGGKRATLDHADSRTLFAADWKDLWSVEVEFTGSDYTLSTTPLTLGEINGKFLTVTATGGVVVIRQTSDVAVLGFSGGGNNYGWELIGFKLTNSNGSKTNAYGVAKGSGNTGGLIARNCIFGDVTNTLKHGVFWDGSTFYGVRLINCEVTECTDAGVQHPASGGGTPVLLGCSVHDCGSNGVYTFGYSSGLYKNCNIYSNTGDGIRHDGSGASAGDFIAECVFDSNGGDGVDISPATGESNVMTIINNQFTNNGGYGLKSDVSSPYFAFADYNNFYNNTSGARTGFVAGANDTAFNPSYVGGSDFTPTNTSLEGTAFPASIP